MAKSTDQKKKLLFIYQLLMERTDEEHPLSTAQIIGELDNMGIQAERKSIYTDIQALEDFGCDIINKKTKPSGYYIASRDFELAELKLLVDAVESARFVTKRKSKELIGKLQSLTNIYEAKHLNRQVNVIDRVKTMNESIYYNVDTLHTALDQKEPITFSYYTWNTNKELVDKKGQLYHVSPWGLTWHDNNYYLVAYDHENEDMRHYRVDKMKNISLLGGKRKGKKYYDNFQISKYVGSTFGMYSGDVETVALRGDKGLAGVIIDRFGTDINIRTMNDEQIEVRIKAAISQQFYGWVAGLGIGVTIQSPEKVREGYVAYISGILKAHDSQEKS